MFIFFYQKAKAPEAQRGFIVGELMAMGMILFSVSAIVVATKAGFDTFRNYEVQSFMVENESYIINGLQSQSVLNELKNQLKSGAIARGTPISLDGRLIARNGEEIVFDAGTQAECSDSSSGTCQKDVRVSLSIQCVDTSDRYRCNAAYVLEAIREGIIFRSGPAAPSKAIVDSDYLVPIPFELAEREFVQSCNSSTDMFASGFDKATGRMRCVSKPTTPSCGANEIAVGIRYDETTNSMRLNCRTLRSISCPSDYVLQRVNPATLDPRSAGAAQGNCVFATQRSVPFLNPPAPSESVSGTFCPRLYRVSFSCPLMNVRSSPGTCYYDCSTTDAKGKVIPQTCSYQVAASPGYVQESSQSGRGLSCTVVIPAQSCGATWTAQTQAVGSCLAEPPENVAAQ